MTTLKLEIPVASEDFAYAVLQKALAVLPGSTGEIGSEPLGPGFPFGPGVMRTVTVQTDGDGVERLTLLQAAVNMEFPHIEYTSRILG